MPLLRKHPEDVLALAQAILKQVASKLDRPIAGLAPDAFKHVLSHPWPGNVRELQPAKEHMVVLAQGRLVTTADLPTSITEASAEYSTVPEASDHFATLASMERAHILRTLSRMGGNRLQTAKVLGISEATIHRKLSRWKREARQKNRVALSLWLQENKSVAAIDDTRMGTACPTEVGRCLRSSLSCGHENPWVHVPRLLTFFFGACLN